jgi:hypothetical protein
MLAERAQELLRHGLETLERIGQKPRHPQPMITSLSNLKHSKQRNNSHLEISLSYFFFFYNQTVYKLDPEK